MMDAFQPSTTEVEATVQSAAVVLCNDKPQTFGAPDVLQVTASRMSAHYTTSMFFSDRPPNQALQVALAISASFLNNSSSRWEAMCESWSVEAELVDTVSPIYRSDHHRCNVFMLCWPDRLAEVVACLLAAVAGLHASVSSCMGTCACHECRITRPDKNAQNRLLWRDKTCPARS